MKRCAAALFFLLLLAIAFTNTGQGQANLVKEIGPGIYMRAAEPEKRIIANTSWIVFRDYVVVIDANYPWGARAVLADLKRTTDKPIRYVFDTHYHGDHSFGNSVWVDAGATIVCSEDCAAESRAKNTPSWAKDNATGDYSLKSYRLEHPQLSFEKTMALDDGTRRVEFERVGPGHTRGDAVAWMPRERILFTGDLVVNRPGNFVGDPDSDPDNWVRALDALARRDIARLVPGHGELGDVAAVRGNRDYLADMIRQVRAAIAKGVPADKMTLDLKSHNPWGQDAERNRTSGLLIYAKLSGTPRK
jgi:glyoxylase-like metal-dependent hydrolase (beta-lactamase superfamily II)